MINPLPNVENACSLIQQEESQRMLFSSTSKKCWEKVGYPAWHLKSKGSQANRQVKTGQGQIRNQFVSRTAAHVESGNISFTPKQIKQLLKIVQQMGVFNAADDEINNQFTAGLDNKKGERIGGTWVYFLEQKSDSFEALKSFIKFVSTHFETQVKIVRSDNALKFVKGQCGPYLLSKGIVHYTSCVDRPQQIDRVERKHKHILDTTRAVRFHAKLPLKFWGVCVTISTYLINGLLYFVIGNVTPYEILLKKKPIYDHLKVFGCLALASNSSRTADKFDPKCVPCVFLALAAVKGWFTCQMDVSNAFLHGDLYEEVYMKVPLGYVGQGKTVSAEKLLDQSLVCKLEKSLGVYEEYWIVDLPHCHKTRHMLHSSAFELIYEVFYLDLGIKDLEPEDLCYDNQAAWYITANPTFHAKTKAHRGGLLFCQRSNESWEC
nr:retrovirus-related Pol polyprotein from transposon TNT 1-94 [Tanacetum cinerariifolium]